MPDSTENIERYGIRELLQKAARLSAKNEAAAAEAFSRGERFNVFHVCKVDHYENLHSAILAEWLNPQGSHGQGDLFLKLFLGRVDKDFADILGSEKATAYTEYSFDEGRLDILLVDNAKHAVIIENKIYAADQDSQLKRYEQFAKKEFEDGNFRIFYLTLDGSNASDNSGKGVTYAPISYCRTILDWMEDCICNVYDKPLIRESMIQYKSLVRELTGVTMDKKIENELIEEMKHSPDGVAAIMSAYPAWERSVLEEHLFTPLKKFSEENGLQFSVNEIFWTKEKWGRFYFEVAPKLLIVFEYEHRGRNSFYYGITDLRENRPEMKTLPGLSGGNDGWRYGWHYLDQHRNWTPEDVAQIAGDKGEFLEYITDAVKNLLGLMREYNIL